MTTIHKATDLLIFGALAALCFLAGVILSPSPQATEDIQCPPNHVLIDYGEIPQAGCMPEGTARELGVLHDHSNRQIEGVIG